MNEIINKLKPRKGDEIDRASYVSAEQSAPNGEVTRDICHRRRRPPQSRGIEKPTWKRVFSPELRGGGGGGGHNPTTGQFVSVTMGDSFPSHHSRFWPSKAIPPHVSISLLLLQETENHQSLNMINESSSSPCLMRERAQRRFKSNFQKSRRRRAPAAAEKR